MAMPELSALIQLRQGSTQTHALKSLRSLKQVSTGTGTKNSEGRTPQEERERAIKAANSFESLLIHNMLKSMRKNTMSEGTSNQRALYDDMLDQRLAETMVEAGGLGIASQLVKQLDPTVSKGEKGLVASTDLMRLREIASTRAAPSDKQTPPSTADTSSIDRLRMVSAFWESGSASQAAAKRQRFLQPLYGDAQQSARRLGTTTEAVLAVAALETGWGQSMIKDSSGKSTYNYFGIKAQPADRQYTQNTTTEFFDGVAQKVQARFKSYTSTADAFRGFADFLIENPRYSDALEHAADPERFLTELQKAGYATDPDYASKAISVLKQINSHPLPL